MTTIFKSILAAILASILSIPLAGCGTPVQRITTTASGNPEVQIDNVDVDAVKSRLLERALTKGFQVESDSASQLVISQELKGMQESLMRLAIANSYSTPVRAVTAITFIKNPAGVKIFSRTTAMSTMPMGQVQKMAMDDANTFNTMQASLDRLKESFN